MFSNAAGTKPVLTTNLVQGFAFIVNVTPHSGERLSLARPPRCSCGYQPGGCCNTPCAPACRLWSHRWSPDRTSPTSMHRVTTSSNNCSNSFDSWKRPWRFFENVE
jgi:hypothetical protein